MKEEAGNTLADLYVYVWPELARNETS